MGVPGRHPFCNRHDRPFSGQPWPVVRLGVPVRASLRVEGSTGIASLTDAARQGWDRASPLPEPFPVVSGHGVPVHPLSRVSFFRASGKRDAQHPTAAALARRGFQTSPARGNREKTRPGLPKAGLPRQGAERESAMPEPGATHAPGEEQPSQSCLAKYRFGVSSALASAFRKPRPTNLFRVGNS